MSPHPAIELLDLGSGQLDFLDDVVYFGAATVPLYVQDEHALRATQATDDVDAIVAATEALREGLDVELVRHGFEWTGGKAGNPPVRWQKGALSFDILERNALPEDDWARCGTIAQHELPSGRTVRCLRYWSLLAAKIAAYEDPRREHARDPQHSRDFADIVLLLVGHGDMEARLQEAGPDRHFVAQWLQSWDPWGLSLAARPHLMHAGSEVALARLRKRREAILTEAEDGSGADHTA